MRLRWVELPVQSAAVVPREAVVDAVAALVPGQRVYVVVSPGKRRRTMHGVLAGRICDLDPAEPAGDRWWRAGGLAVASRPGGRVLPCRGNAAGP